MIQNQKPSHFGFLFFPVRQRPWRPLRSALVLHFSSAIYHVADRQHITAAPERSCSCPHVWAALPTHPAPNAAGVAAALPCFLHACIPKARETGGKVSTIVAFGVAHLELLIFCAAKGQQASKERGRRRKEGKKEGRISREIDDPRCGFQG